MLPHSVVNLKLLLLHQLHQLHQHSVIVAHRIRCVTSRRPICTWILRVTAQSITVTSCSLSSIVLTVWTRFTAPRDASRCLSVNMSALRLNECVNHCVILRVDTAQIFFAGGGRHFVITNGRFCKSAER